MKKKETTPRFTAGDIVDAPSLDKKGLVVKSTRWNGLTHLVY